jgi:Predicted membrane protein (DUF2154).
MKIKNILWGLFFLGSGGLLILHQLGYFSFINPIQLILVLLLGICAVTSLFKLNFFGVFMPVAIITVLFKNDLGINNISTGTIILSAAFVSIGLHIIFAKQCKKSYVSVGCFSDKEIIEDCEDDEIINLSTNFGSVIKYINTENFKKLKINSSFAGVKVYFDNAKIVGDKAEINVNVSFSGVELFIPKNWNVVSSANVNLAGIDEKNKGKGDGPTVVITGSLSLAGIEIIYV